MKTIFFLSVILFSTLAFAAPKKADTAPETSANRVDWEKAKYGFGFASMGEMTGTSAALTGLVEFDQKNWLQPLAFLDGTSPAVFGIGALYKRVVASRGNAGFHLGGGFTMGSVIKSAGGTGIGAGIAAIGGFHVEFPGADQILLQLDGGPVLTFGDRTNFIINPLSGAFGLSAVYRFQ